MVVGSSEPIIWDEVLDKLVTSRDTVRTIRDLFCRPGTIVNEKWVLMSEEQIKWLRTWLVDEGAPIHVKPSLFTSHDLILEEVLPGDICVVRHRSLGEASA